MSDPDVSIIVPSRGGAARLPLLLDALSAQRGIDPARVQVLVVLDGDLDGSAAVLAARVARAPFDLQVVALPQWQGRVGALNAGFAAATGRILARCDDDLIPGPDYLAAILARHERPDAVGVIGMCRNEFDDTAYARVYGRAADSALRAQAYAAPAHLRWRHWHGNVSVTRTTAERVGAYDLDYRAYGWEDIDWGYRLHRAGVEVVLAPELETVHRAAAVTTAGRALRAWYAGSARRLFESKHPDSGLPSVPDSLTGPWGRAVAAAARRHTEAGVAAWGERVDRALPALPTAVGRKAVALLVESAAVAGYRHPERVGTAI